MRTIETDYLVVGAGAMGMAFTDALVDHADVHVTLVDRRHHPGGHWRDAYSFVRLHQASLFYGVPSTRLGDGALQSDGPEAGLHERAGLAEIQAYFDHVLQRRFLDTGRVSFRGGSTHATDGDRHLVTSHLTGETVEVRAGRVVDATYLAPTIPSTSQPPFAVADDARVLPINDLPAVADTPSEFVIVGSGKTATDAIVWLLGSGVDPDAIVWVRPRDPWMLNRATVQPDPVVFTRLGADTMEAAAAAGSLEDLFRGLEDAGVLLRIDDGVLPTMARTPTLASWELELLRSVERVVRLGHVRAVERTAITLADGSIPLPDGAVVVHCAASGLAQPAPVPIWGPDRIRLQTIRAGFPCFCAALAGYVEATRDDDVERNRLCPPNSYSSTLAQWARMQADGARASACYSAEPDIATWATATTLNPARVDPDLADDPALLAEQARLAAVAEAGLRGLSRLASPA